MNARMKDALDETLILSEKYVRDLGELGLVIDFEKDHPGSCR